MSTPSTHDSRTASGGGLALGRLLWPVEALSFWAAVTLPFLYLPLLLFGTHSDAELLTCLALIVVHAVSLVLGHAHSPGATDE